MKKVVKILLILLLFVLVLGVSIFIGARIGGSEKNNSKSNTYNKINNHESCNDDNETLPIEYKPIIYLYPTKDTITSIKLGFSEKLTCSYPKYTSEGWNVLATSDGNLTDISTNKNLYSLYYESENAIDFNVEEDGFIVKGEDTVTFLEEKLSILGLTEREAEEFIIYWLPKLEKNKYNYIRFATNDEINKNMPLEISPSPDTEIRILMTYKELDEPIDIKEQKLHSIERNGFVLVEWGGTEIK